MVTVTSAPIRLARVAHGEDYQLVVGGRLVLSVKGGIRQPHAELPTYTPAEFPGSFMGWSDGETEGVEVEVAKKPGGKLRPASGVLACMTLFTPHDAEAVRDWIRRNAK